jgi:ABC-type multidrug transport system fused ATPase/permease subunit
VPSGGLKDLGFSEGEEQKAHLLHIIAREWRVICLDEATAHIGFFRPRFDNIDEASEKKILQEISAKNGTMILITHKMNLLKGLDQIIVIHEGSVVGVGPHKALILENKSYQSMVVS